MRLIVQRAFNSNKDLDTQSLEMDLCAVHISNCKLDLEKLLTAPQFDFAHDIYGIIGHMNRKTLKLENCFLPRCSA